ncbi:MAG: hypothetical protein NTW19_13020 [Planctomycetota bacterium]|nr:hypothetical protein [Planctomycetota bacterium]
MARAEGLRGRAAFGLCCLALAGGCRSAPARGPAPGTQPATSQPAEVQPPVAPWVDKAQRALANAAGLNDRVQKLKSAPAATQDGNRTAPQWINREYALPRTQHELRRSLIELWFATGCPRPVVAVKYEDLPEAAPGLIARYRRFIERNSRLPRESILHSQMHYNVEALDTEYVWPALWFLQETISFNPSIHITHHMNGEILEVAEANRHKIHKKMSDWYFLYEPSLVWEPRFSQFMLRGYRQLPFPIELGDLP